MNIWRIFSSVNEAKIQLLRLRKVVSETRKLVYLVDGKEYSDSQLIQLANSIVS